MKLLLVGGQNDGRIVELLFDCRTLKLPIIRMTSLRRDDFEVPGFATYTRRRLRDTHGRMTEIMVPQGECVSADFLIENRLRVEYP